MQGAGLPNDTIEIDNGEVKINGEVLDPPKGLQNRYFVETDVNINERVFKKYNIWEYTKVTNGYYINTQQKNADDLSRESFINEVTVYRMDKSNFQQVGYFLIRIIHGILISMAH